MLRALIFIFHALTLNTVVWHHQKKDLGPKLSSRIRFDTVTLPTILYSDLILTFLIRLHSWCSVAKIARRLIRQRRVRSRTTDTPNSDL